MCIGVFTKKIRGKNVVLWMTDDNEYDYDRVLITSSVLK
jgi:hypothetical protein